MYSSSVFPKGENKGGKKKDEIRLARFATVAGGFRAKSDASSPIFIHSATSFSIFAGIFFSMT